jgi:hypothetical protein
MPESRRNSGWMVFMSSSVIESPSVADLRDILLTDVSNDAIILGLYHTKGSFLLSALKDMHQAGCRKP